MVRSRERFEVSMRGIRQAAVWSLVALLMAPACAGRSISGDDDEGDDRKPTPPVSGDDDVGGGRSGGVGAVGNAGAFSGGSPAGGSFPSGGDFSTTGGSFPMGGVSTTGGFSGIGGQPGGTAGTSPCGGGIADPAGGTGSGPLPPVNTDPDCRGISNNAPCALDGKMCANLACGLADSGRRHCACTGGTWTCMSCDFSGSPWVSRPCDILPCPDGIADEVVCASEGALCGPQPDGEYCACWNSPSDGMSWDCDNPPSTWGL